MQDPGAFARGASCRPGPVPVAMSEAIQAVRSTLVAELGAEARRRDVWRAANKVHAQHYSQGRIDALDWALRVLGYLEPAP